MRGRQSRSPVADHVAIGQIVAPHGIKGALRVKVLTDFPERFDSDAVVWLQGVEHRIVRSVLNGSQLLLTLEGIDDRNRAEELKWEYLTVPASEVPELDADEFLARDLLDLGVVTTDGRHLGKVTDVMPNPAHDILVIGDVMIPLVREFVKEIDLEKCEILVQVIPGMIPEVEE